MMKLKGKIIGLMASVCLFAGLMPMMAYAAETGVQNNRTIMFGLDGISDPSAINVDGSGTYYEPNSYIYFGAYNGMPIKWRVLDADKANDGMTNGMFLLSEYLLDSKVYFKTSSPNINGYQGSDAQLWCTTFAADTNAFSMVEQAAFLGIDKIDVAQTADVNGQLYGKNWGQGELKKSTDKIFLLSVKELADYVGNYNKALGMLAYYHSSEQSSDVWWLRSTKADDFHDAGAVNNIGNVVTYYIGIRWGARPACNLNSNAVLFTSVSGDGKSSELVAVTDYNAKEWKLTLEDSGKNVSVASGQNVTKTGSTVTVPYTYSILNGSSVNQISVMITDKEYTESNAQILYYGALQNIKDASGNASTVIDAATGSGTFVLPGGLPDGYKVYILAEDVHIDDAGTTDVNEANLSDHASAPVEITITVAATGITGAPTASPVSGTYAENQKIALTSSTEGAVIYYTVDGSEPTRTATKYTMPIEIKGEAGKNVTTTIRAIAVKEGMQDSEEAEFTYVIQLSETVKHTVTVNNGTITVAGSSLDSSTADGDWTDNSTGSGSYEPGVTVTVSANVPAQGQTFKGWRVEKGNIILSDIYNALTSFLMPDEDVELTAEYTNQDTDEDHPATDEDHTAADADRNSSESPHNCSFEWKITKQASSTQDGEEIYYCITCGNVIERRTISSYEYFNKEIKKRIEVAPENGIVEVNATPWVSYVEYVLKALEKRCDVTLVTTFRYQGKEYRFTIPARKAGTDGNILVEEDVKYYGFLYLSEKYGRE